MCIRDRARVDKLGGDIYDQPKFSQKDFEKDIKKTQKIGDKSFKADVKKFKKIGLKPPKRGDFTSKFRPGGNPVIPDPFGKGDTPGQIRVKGLETKAFKKTQPSDIKLPKSFTDFSSKLQDYKDKDKATMRTGKSSSKVKVSGANNLSRQDVGMAPPDTPKKPKPQKGVSATEITKKFDNIIAEKAIKNQQSKLSKTAADLEKQTEKIDAAKQKLRSATGTKDVKKIRQLNVQGREYRKLTQATKKAASGVGNPNAPVKYNKMTAGADFIKKNRVKTMADVDIPDFIKKKNRANTKLVTKSASKKPVSFTIPGAKGPKSIKDVKLPQFGLGAKKYATKRGADIAFAKSPAGKIVKKVGFKPLKYGTRAVIKRAGIPGAIVGLGLATPTGRRIAQTVLGGTLGGIIGSKTKKKSTAPTFKKDSQGRDITYSRTRGFNLSPSKSVLKKS